jgi:acyl CoA:acetate/3-ketoacid CoA transferase
MSPQWTRNFFETYSCRAGEYYVHELAPKTMALTERKIIARRSALELQLGKRFLCLLLADSRLLGAVVNLGIGLPEGVAQVGLSLAP